MAGNSKIRLWRATYFREYNVLIGRPARSLNSAENVDEPYAFTKYISGRGPGDRLIWRSFFPARESTRAVWLILSKRPSFDSDDGLRMDQSKAERTSLSIAVSIRST